MASKWSRHIVLLIMGACTCVTSTAQVGSFNAAQRSNFTAQVRAGDLAEVQGTILDVCGPALKEARRAALTIDERFDRAKEADFCFKSFQSLIAAVSSDPNAERVAEPFIQQSEAAVKEAGSAIDFMSLTWGLGFGYSFGQDDAVDEAVIVDNVVRVKSEKRDQPRAVLEFHRYFWCNGGRTKSDRGCGPFVAVAATSDDALAGVGVGWMYGRRTSPTDTEGFSVGVGVILDGNVMDLAEGFKDGQPPPGTETVVRYEEKSRWSALIIVSRTF